MKGALRLNCTFERAQEDKCGGEKWKGCLKFGTTAHVNLWAVPINYPRLLHSNITIPPSSHIKPTLYALQNFR